MGLHQILPELCSGRGTAAEGGGGGAPRGGVSGSDERVTAPLARPLHRLRRSPSPSELGEEFAGHAARLAGFAGLLFGWAPETFWSATPAELGALVRAAGGEAAEPVDGAALARLKELFPDG